MATIPVCAHCGQPLTYALTPAQVRCLQLLARGLANQEIATELVVSPLTVKAHLSSVYQHLHVRGRVEAVITAQRLGILEFPKPVSEVGADETR